ncbi:MULTISPECIES: SDR family oxidoreductase [unclassified Mycobacterium]|uniref:SDR family oxidoreductase n=1 Tax=unclassified Mycobacterium TaxID=2642494 RepID=UPI000FB27014|nr:MULTISPECIES: SDR family oxidoreductase [unclassified Mycobacterium]MDP7702079.1 SDR family oxidoreductase [Mycobacterium sp. TY815]MDP7726250.1 SDR family oxidoreductase [Mycobacterium sp. TY814]RUP05645.1 MAG: SDR family oxidoreductase [Mycobacterium sp.]
MLTRNPIRLDGAAVAITGGARGIGLATAKAFAANGSRVFIGDLDADLAAAAAAEIGGHGMALDVRSRQSFATFLDAVDAFGTPLAVLVNNAGIMPAGRFADEDDAITDAILDINTRGVLIGTKLALPGMLSRSSGHIVNVSSYLGKVPAAGLATYCASKHAVVGFSEALRDEIAGSGVTVSVVLPCAVRTELTAGVKLGGVLPTVDPEDIAGAVLRSCAHRRAVVALPGWMRVYEATAAAVPDRLVAAVRGRLTRARVLRNLDTQARSGYEARVRGAAETL